LMKGMRLDLLAPYREPLGTSCPEGGSSGSGWRMVTTGETEPQEDVTSRDLRKEGTVTHQ
jgi:hypothetical protein